MVEGIPYFTLDCQFDDKIKEIEDEFGMKGLGVIVKLLQLIYGVHGYYCEWDDRVASRFARREAFVGIDVVREIVAAALRESQNHEPFFDKEMYEKYGILTSRGIQKRYLKAAKAMKRKDIFPIAEYVLIPFDFPETDGNSQNNINCSRKKHKNSSLNESNVNKSNVNKSSAGSCAPAAAFNSKEGLVEKYGVSAVAEYEARFRKWQTKQGAVRVEMYEAISKWMERDGVKPRVTDNSSIDVDAAMKEILDKYKGGS